MKAKKQPMDPYPVKTTPHLDNLMDSADSQDPIARQFLPSTAEANLAPDEHPDPIGDETHMPVRGLVHRYPDRVLLKPVHVCAAYCRFCFRREMVGPGGETLTPRALDTALAYIRNTQEIWEVILSGGDPLILSPQRLTDLMRRLDEIEHVKIIRIHTRLPIMDPARITDDLLQALSIRKPVFVSLHCNHPKELSKDVVRAVARLTAAGIPLIAQTVLLKGVNDDADTLEALFRRLVELKVKPYHLHHCDKAPGTSHFRTTIAEGQALMRALRGRVSGLCLPEYVLDIPGGYGKIPVTPCYMNVETDEARDPSGRVHRIT